ncbi:hypothetical protein SAMN04487897_1092 [Paenibacillus sp. yr247]|uniref:hypothetical protein n=1 Tax=Paenibacillus sp. yr247 TaxID=1761880 RepID=UPI00088E25C0|nr:hypothetical protein [Paenibacillus sp. yr247]SDO14773.1 hypothetical protein SAMN04487897_1092 [Paenibacillus sp. yr247]
MSDRMYYSERIGIEKEKLSLKELSTVFVVIVNELTKKDYFKEFFGYEDNFGRTVEGSMGNTFENYSLAVLGRRISDPFYNLKPNYTEVDLFDAIELLHDNVTLKTIVDEFGLGPAFAEFNITESQSVYRSKINKHLARYGSGWELLEDGTIRELVQEEFRGLVDSPIQYGEEENVDKRIRRAAKSFLKYGASELDKKAALIEIGGALEYIRTELEEFNKKATSDIFNLLNNYDLRHNNKLKHADYDVGIYYPWMFYTFLSTYNAFVMMKKK